jgi:hypothetical protein
VNPAAATATRCSRTPTWLSSTSRGKPCSLPGINNIGLFGEDFPDQRRTDRYVILLTGGSVASQLGQYQPPPAPRYLEEELNRNYVSPNGKPFSC